MTISQMRNWLISVIKRIRATGPLTSAASVASWQQSGLARQVSITILLVAILLIGIVLARPIQERFENGVWTNQNGGYAVEPSDLMHTSHVLVEIIDIDQYFLVGFKG